MARRIERPALLIRKSTPPCFVVQPLDERRAARPRRRCRPSRSRRPRALAGRSARISRFGLDQLGLVARADDGDRAGLGELARRRQADARRAAGDQHHLAADRAAAAMRSIMQRRVEVALPVVPQPPRVVVEVRALDAASPSARRSVSRQSKRVGIVDEGRACRRAGRGPSSPRCLMRRTGASAIRPFFTLFGNEAEQRGVDEQVHLRRMRRLG